MAIENDPKEYIAALGNFDSSSMGPTFGSASVDNLNNVGMGSFFKNIMNLAKQQQAPQLGPDDFGSYVIPASDPTFRSGLNYARSIASGGNIPGMISSGTSYSSEMPQGFTQADINAGLAPNPFYVEPPAPQGTPSPYGVFADDPSYFGTGIGGVNIPTDRHDETPKDIFGGLGGAGNKKIHISHTGLDEQIGSGYQPLNTNNFPPLSNLLDIGKLFAGEIDFSSILDGLNSDISNVPADTPPPVIPGAVSGPVDMPLPPISIGGVGGRDIEDRILIDDMPRFIEEDFFTPKEIIQGPVDMPLPPKQKDQLFIDDIPRFEDIPSIEYVVPEVPLNNLLNQSPPQGPVGMSPQETAKMSSQQELSNLISNKDILQEIPADDGVRNQYQVELDEYINKSPINMDTYKEKLPVGSAINLGIPAVMEAVVPMAVPGLSLATNISNSLSSNNNPSPASRPSTPSVSRPSVSRPNYSHTQVSKFGR